MFMSRFIEKLKQASLSAPQQQMGFRVSTSSSSKPGMLLIACLTEGSKGMDFASYVGGADAGGIDLSGLPSGYEILKKLSKDVSEIPWGGRIADTGGDEIEMLAGAGADFVLFPASSSIKMSLKEGMGRVLEIETSIGENLLRAVDQMPVDAVLIGDVENSITYHRLMLYRRYATVMSKPMLVSIPPSGVAGSELQALWDAGVSGVLVKVDAGQAVGTVNEMRKAMDKLTVPARNKRQKDIGALLPNIGMTAEEEVEEEEEE
jgi:hypothetical protein